MIYDNKILSLLFVTGDWGFLSNGEMHCVSKHINKKYPYLSIKSRLQIVSNVRISSLVILFYCSI